MAPKSLAREDWLRAARLALHRSGPDAVRVETLAAALGVTKGSFYWHFSDREELLDALISEWEEEDHLAAAQLPALEDARAFRNLIKFVAPRVAASPRGTVPSDAAMFAWAAVDPAVARRVNAAEERRVALVQRVTADDELGEFIYLAYLGYLMRRRRAASTGGFFPALARIAEKMVDASKRQRARTRRARKRGRKRSG